MVTTGRGVTDGFIFFILLYIYNKYIILVKSEKNINIKKKRRGEFSGSPVVRTPRFHCRRPRFNPWLGN